ncbi:MAG: hypothetical protein KJ893_06620 [Candidatus Omnitrophica bacterium]|nr:hypothetical protein [Candidatus Omnitrophota bacterium]MBU4479453.1 hypothetical protein [Candidatus Omnitrophota bacterium]
MKYIIQSILIIIMFTSTLNASSISRLSLSDLEKKSDLIVIAIVEKVEANGDLDTVDIRISSILKGAIKEKNIKLRLQVRGGLKEWDPILTKGQAGVFFLKKSIIGEYRLAYPGSISVFKNTIYE